MSQRNWVYPLIITSVDTAGIAADTWTAFDTAGFEVSPFMISINNDSNTDIFISWNGTDRHEFIATDRRLDVNFQTNASPPNFVSKPKLGQVLYVQGVAGVGLVYLSGYYNQVS
jgi:hypothetical protein